MTPSELFVNAKKWLLVCFGKCSFPDNATMVYIDRTVIAHVTAFEHLRVCFNTYSVDVDMSCSRGSTHLLIAPL